jgi:acetyl esterase/lipase
MNIRLIAALTFAVLAFPTHAVDEKPLEVQVRELTAKVEELEWSLDQVRKSSDDALFWLRLSDVAEIDKVILAGPGNPRGKERYGIENSRHPLRIYQYVFMPKKLDKSKKHPAIVLSHGGVHGDFGTYHVHMVREMVERGYIVLAPEYRGSSFRSIRSGSRSSAGATAG